MAEQDAEVVRDHFAATNERDFERAMGHYADEVVMVVSPEVGPNAGVFEGKGAVGEWFGDWFRQFGVDYRFEVEELRDLGQGRVLVVETHGGTGRASGAKVQGQNANLYRVQDGMIVRVQLFASPADALRAAELPEWSQPETD
jgi:ketosteroid isomerase-like protein